MVLLLNKTNSQLKNYTNQLLEILKNAKCINFLKFKIWSADFADMQLISKFDKGIRFLLCVIDVFSKHTQVVHLKDKKGVTIVNAF